MQHVSEKSYNSLVIRRAPRRHPEGTSRSLFSDLKILDIKHFVCNLFACALHTHICIYTNILLEEFKETRDIDVCSGKLQYSWFVLRAPAAFTFARSRIPLSRREKS